MKEDLVWVIPILVVKIVSTRFTEDHLFYQGIVLPREIRPGGPYPTATVSTHLLEMAT